MRTPVFVSGVQAGMPVGRQLPPPHPQPCRVGLESPAPVPAAPPSPDQPSAGRTNCYVLEVFEKRLSSCVSFAIVPHLASFSMAGPLTAAHRRPERDKSTCPQNVPTREQLRPLSLLPHRLMSDHKGPAYGLFLLSSPFIGL